MFNNKGQIELHLGSSTNITSQITIHGRDHPIYLTNPPYVNDQPLIDNFALLYFLSTFNNKKYSFTQTQTIKKTRKIAKQIFTHFITISRNQTELFKIFFQTSGNHFVIQVLNACDKIKYSKKNILLNKKERLVYVFNKKIRTNLDPTLPIQIQKNDGISELSDYYNNKSVNRSEQNQITSSLFYSVAPFNPKTIKHLNHKMMNPDNTIEGIFENFGGTLFKFHPKEKVNLIEYPFEVFAYFSPYFTEIVESKQFNLSTTIELDATFRALAPYALCVPTLIFRNTGIPLGILISPSEKTSLYSLFFESLKKFDEVNKNSEENSLFLKFKKKKYLTDEHKAFTKLSSIYGLDIYNCLVHLIRSIGANSLLGLLMKDMVFTFSGHEWSHNQFRFYHTLRYLYESRNQNDDDNRFIKVCQVLGINLDGNEIETKKEYSPIYKRLDARIPTTTNHVESMHKQINTLFKGSRMSLHLRLAYIIKYIMDRTLRTNASAHSNLKAHFKNLKQIAKNAVSKNKDSITIYTKEYCACYKQIYYSVIFWIDIPCIHTILCDNFNENEYINEMRKLDINFSFKKEKFKVYDIETNMTFRKRKNKNVNDDDDDDKPPINIGVEEFNEENALKRIIKHTESQLSSVINKYNLNFTVIAVDLNTELLLNDEIREIKLKNEEEYLALFQVKLWFKILEGRKNIVV